MAKSKRGILLIADITGYTAYLSATELEHAQGTLSALLELLLEHTRPPLILSRLAGDAVISYALQGSFGHGQTFVELLEDTYVAFRKAIERMVLNNSCQCAACANVGNLDLKFFVHFGTFGVQRLSAHDELVGSDVNLLHRLLKNHVTDETGYRAYTLYSAAAIEEIGLGEISASMMSHTEAYEHLGEVQVWIQDMHAVWQRKQDSVRVIISPERVIQEVEIEIAMPPELVWDYLGQPVFRSIIIGSDRQEVLQRKDGRIAPGSVFQCYHGDAIILQTTLEWQPFEYMLTEDLLPLPGIGTLVQVMISFRLEPTATGTRLKQSLSKAKGPWHGRLMSDMFVRASGNRWRGFLVAFKEATEGDLRARSGDADAAMDGAVAVTVEDPAA